MGKGVRGQGGKGRIELMNRLLLAAFLLLKIQANCLYFFRQLRHWQEFLTVLATKEVSLTTLFIEIWKYLIKNIFKYRNTEINKRAFVILQIHVDIRHSIANIIFNSELNRYRQFQR